MSSSNIPLSAAFIDGNIQPAIKRYKLATRHAGLLAVSWVLGGPQRYVES